MRRLPLVTILLALVFATVQALSPLAAAAGDWLWPVQGDVITTYRNGNDPYAGGQHRGIDVAAAVGDPVVAATAGTVRFAGIAGSSGLTVSLRTADGRFDTSYLHLSAIKVRAGDRVRAGDHLAAVGTTGRPSTQQPHLHFGVREAGTRHAYLDPLDFLPTPPPARAPDPPPAAPVPVGAPVSTAPQPALRPVPALAPRPAPAPVGAPAPGPRPVRIPAGRRVPGRAPLPGPRPQPRGAPAATPREAPEPIRDPVRSPAPGLAGAPGAAHPAGPAVGTTARRPLPAAPAPRLGIAPADPRAAAANGSAAEHRRRGEASERRAGGIDIGWALACVGLALTALLLGRPRRAGRPRSPCGCSIPSSIGANGLLRHHPDLLRKRGAASRPRLLHDRGRRPRAAHAPAR